MIRTTIRPGSLLPAAALLLAVALPLAGCEQNPLEQLGYTLSGPGKSYQPPAPGTNTAPINTAPAGTAPANPAPVVAPTHLN